jgi:putative ABC transport system permease protein
MRDVAYLAWRYLAYHRFKSAILVLSVALILYVPAGLRVLVWQSERELTARAASTPLLIGAKGSSLELVLKALYAGDQNPPLMRYGEVAQVAASGLAQPIPLYVRFHAQNDPIAGTTLDYFVFRGIRVAAGRQMTRLGECVVGAEVARRRGIQPGDSVISSTETLFDVAGVYPLKMHVAGILAPTGTPDDQVIFADLKTTWVIEGLAHGHEDVARPEAAGGVLRREGARVAANASVVQYNEITPENIGSFHFHGDLATYPITAIIALPPDEKAATLLMGRYQAPEHPHQIVRPLAVIEQLLGTVLTIQNFVVATLAIVGAATLATAALVFLLSLRLRRREIETLSKIGASRRRIAALMASEIAGVAGIGIGLAGLLTWITGTIGADLIRRLIVH